VLLNRPPVQLIAGNIDEVVWFLRNPMIRQILPACARDAIPSTDSKLAGQKEGWLSNCAMQMLRGWKFFLGAGLLSLAYGAIWEFKISRSACADT
jgi:hypothetical protein